MFRSKRSVHHCKIRMCLFNAVLLIYCCVPCQCIATSCHSPILSLWSVLPSMSFYAETVLSIDVSTPGSLAPTRTASRSIRQLNLNRLLLLLLLNDRIAQRVTPPTCITLKRTPSRGSSGQSRTVSTGTPLPIVRNQRCRLSLFARSKYS